MKRLVLRNRFNILLAEKAHREVRSKITITEVVEKTGLARSTVDRIAHNSVSMYDNKVVLAICVYLGCTPGELLVIEDVEDSNGMTAQRLAVAS